MKNVWHNQLSATAGAYVALGKVHVVPTRFAIVASRQDTLKI